MGDHLPDATSERSTLATNTLSLLESYGYERVITPVFEHAKVWEKGLELDQNSLIRFVESETGEIANLRPDFTPQIARIVTTRLKDKPPPFRLCYNDTVFRKIKGRARTSRQCTQVGFECIGLNSKISDIETIELAILSCKKANLQDFRIELGQVEIAARALHIFPTVYRSNAAFALAKKDRYALEHLSEHARLSHNEKKIILHLVDLYGKEEIFPKAEKIFHDTSMKKALMNLRQLYDLIGEKGYGDLLEVDLGELRGHAYYTGISFSVLAYGPGEPLGRGGRYDKLLKKFGGNEPAIGFSLDIDNLVWALSKASISSLYTKPIRLAALEEVNEQTIQTLRNKGIQVATLSSKKKHEAIHFAKAWNYDGILTKTETIMRTSDQKEQRLDKTKKIDQLMHWMRGFATEKPSS